MTAESISLLGVIFGTLTCTQVFDCVCDPDSFCVDSYGGIILWFLICLYMFKQLGAICDEYFVPSLEVIVEKLELSNDVAGATFMAAGSSAPELFTSLTATFFIVNEGGIGTIVGSAIFNILVIVGATAWCATKEAPLEIWWYPLTRDCIFYMISILELLIFLIDSEIHWYESTVMVFTYAGYIFYMWMNPGVISFLGLVEPGQDVCEELPPGTAAIAVMDVSDETAPSSWQDPVHEVGWLANGDGTVEKIVQGDPVCMNGDHSGKVRNADLPSAVPKAVSICDVEGDEKTVPPANGFIKQTSDPGDQQQHCGKPTTEVILHPVVKVAAASDDDCFREPIALESFVDPTSSATPSSTYPPPPSRHANPVRSHTRSDSRIIMSMATAQKESRTGSKASAQANGNVKIASVVPSSGSSAEVAEETEVFEDVEKKPPPEDDGSLFHSLRFLQILRDPLSLVLKRCMPPPERHWLLFTLSIILIMATTYIMVDSVNRAGVILKVPPMVMGLTVLAAGTSIPDMMGSIAVAKQGEGDMAVANALGSNIFDILVGLGVPWTIKCAMGKRVIFGDGEDAKFELIALDIGILAFVLLLFVGFLLLNKWRLTRMFGSVLLFFYVANVVYNIIAVYVLRTKTLDD